MAAWRYEISPCGHVVSSIYLPVNKERWEVENGRRGSLIWQILFSRWREE